MRKWCLLLLVLLASTSVKGQIVASYFGESGFHPGIKIGYQHTLSENEKTKKRWLKGRESRVGPKVKKREVFVLGSAAVYNHPNNHTGVLLNSELGWKRTKMRRGQTFGANVGLGYLQRLYNIPTYELGGNDTPEEIGGAGQGMLVTSFALSWGRDLSVKKDIPLSWHVKPIIMLQTPYLHTPTLNGALEIGVVYDF